MEDIRDALQAVIEAYEDMGRAIPPNLLLTDATGPVWLETPVATR